MTYTAPEQITRVNRAFSNQSKIFDGKVESNLITRWMRNRVRNHALSVLKPGSHILELNAGTGLDAVFMAEHGHSVHATDVSDGMVAKIREKIDAGAKNVSAEKRSFTDLRNLPASGFDCIFSNFGGLNCTAELKEVVRQFQPLLKPEGIVILVVMPRICPWEILSVFKGHFRKAARRLRNQGAHSHLEGEFFTTWYYNPSQLISYFSDGFSFIGLQGLGSLVPPPYKEEFPHKYPKIFSALCRWEEKLAGRWPFNRMADHYILTMKLKA
jgi:ubiquinone/menaquinone biosynthesis C-methylase UbiE